MLVKWFEGFNPVAIKLNAYVSTYVAKMKAMTFMLHYVNIYALAIFT